jgi:hypothetical protein
MSHFAKVEDGVVTNIIVAEQDFIDNLEGTWIQTSYNTVQNVHVRGGTPLRKNYAIIGGVYDSGRDAFYASQPYASWTLVEDTCEWLYPIPIPNDMRTTIDGEGKNYDWDEDLYQSDNTKGWVEVE